MAERNPYDRKTQPREWQGWIDEQTRKHDEQVKDSQGKGILDDE